MIIYTKEEAKVRINSLANAGKKFLFIINYKQDGSYIEEINKINQAELMYDLNGETNCQKTKTSEERNKSFLWQPHPTPFTAYDHSFNIVKRNILAGNSFLTNLTCSTPITTNLSIEEIFYRSKAPYKLWIKDRFVCFSPEIFVRIQQGNIFAYPMKGTIDANIPNAKQQLMNDPKEIAEHATITDLIRNDLSIVAEQVKVVRYRYVDTVETNQGPILQTSTEISGQLPPDYGSHLGEILFKILPAGSITGAPKTKTMEIISKAEDYERGFYTGVVGYFDGKNLESAVMIRFIEEKDGILFFKSGGGITSQSKEKSEYQEMIQKVYVPIY